MIKIVPFSEIYQEETYHFVWNNMTNVLNKEPNKLKKELKSLKNIKKKLY